MPRPHFITCQLCGKGFGSASINIHIPQCYEKAIKRWKLDPVGPRPVMPALRGNAGPAGKAGGNGGTGRNTTMLASGTVGFDDQPCGGGVAAARSLHAPSMPPMMEEAPPNMNLHPCSKCGRNFNFDRIAYHESVCKGDQKRRVFDSSKQRGLSGEDDGGFGSVFDRSGGGKGMKKKRRLGTANTTSRYTPAPAPKTNWRQQHEEFIEAIRSAKLADAESHSMWGNSSAAVAPNRAPMAPTRGAQRAPFPRYANQGRTLGGGGSATGATPARGMPPPAQRVPPSMLKQSESRKQNIATGGRAAKAKMSAPMGPPRGGTTRPGNGAPPQRSSFGGTGDRFSGRGYDMGGGGGGGGGGGRILNENTTSVGMLQSMGLA
ncbi:hypothetical protein ABB37_04956 [Leptomonas pyrrhocoris]|uniref:C2HC/C3H-type domain-containing protein n=1 Tax=Leptomonas pyrrhocoris TaxID=157538 RepID=A0A0M9G0U6_LEPPY|nr:hypothetical protein ABB37_04956 [Leptomonas pyrrhocoris]KPA79887.1 hypothetical protein ABB37_04956 [Leptomonas pyrrhocoris]|eukprot:XP_015658326.1 hypothetical protein ABB37_04956 [Leptomonas pyrrhocoris]